MEVTPTFLVVLISCLLFLSICAAAATASPTDDAIPTPPAVVQVQQATPVEGEAMADTLDELNDSQWQALLRKWPPRARFEAGWESAQSESCFQRLGERSLDAFDFGPYMQALDEQILKMRRQSEKKFGSTIGFSKIAFTYSQNGGIENVFVCRTSGDQRLNEKARSLVRKLPKMAPLPKDGPTEVRCYYNIYGNNAMAESDAAGDVSDERGHISGRVLTGR